MMTAVTRCVVLAVATVGLASALAVGAAFAHDEPNSREAKVLVQQAIALIDTRPADHHAIEERVEAALKAPITHGVDLSVVKHAMTALKGDDFRRARELLQTSIGAGPVVAERPPKPIRETSGEPGKPAAPEPEQPTTPTGMQTGTTVVLDEYEPARGVDSGDVALLALSAVSILAGGLLAWRFRPPDSARRLRRAAPEGGGL